MTDRLVTAVRRTVALVRGEQTVEDAAYTALMRLTALAAAQLQSSGMDPSVLDSRAPAWQHAIDTTVLPAVRRIFDRAYDAGLHPDARAALTAAAQPVEPLPDRALSLSNAAAERYLLNHARNRLVGVSDTVFNSIIAALTEGRETRVTLADGSTAIGESIPQLAARIDSLLTDTQRWRNRATVIARTEAISAHNAGYHTAASDSAHIMGYAPGQVAKEWLATGDTRTRPSHAEASGETVVGLHTPFAVGGADLQYPGDPVGPAGEVIQCRCTTLYHYPGDPGYPVTASASLSTSGPLNPHTDRAQRQEHPMTTSLTAAPPAETPTGQLGVIVAALPAADDPVHGIGEEDKHATLLFFGNLPGSGGDQENPGLTADFQALLTSTVAALAADTETVTSTVQSVESLGDDGARVWLLDDSLAAVRDALLAADPELQSVLDGVTQFPTFTPHVTIDYPPTAPADAEDVDDSDAPDADDAGPDAPAPVTDPLDPAVEEAAAAVTSITFDRLAIWWTGEQTEYPLTAAAQAPAPETAAAGVLEAFARTLSRDGAVDYDAALSALRTTYADVAPALPTDQPVPDAGPAKAQDIAADGEPFYGIAWPEDVQSGDGRGIASGATVWRDLPLPVMAQEATAPGHEGAVRVGRMDVIERDDTTYAVPVIRYSGVWDTSPVAVETARQVDQKMLRGISVDGDAVTVELHDSAGNPLDPMVDDFPADGVVIEVATEARIAGGTTCSIPAFQQAYIANGTLADRTDPEPGWNDDGTPKDNTLSSPAETPEAVAASAVTGEDMAPAWTLVASGAPLPVWPSADFANPGLTEPTRLTVTDDGRVYGHLAVWGVCHIGIDGVCQEPPVSHTDYAYFQRGKVETTDGYVATGPLTMGTGHAAMNLRGPATVRHYDDTGTAVADVAMGQDGLGIWFAGRIRPGTTPEQVYAMRAAGSVSGDWREQGTGLELMAALVVNVPGFPIVAPAVAASGATAYALIASGVVPAPETPAVAEHPVTATDLMPVVAAAMMLLQRRDAATSRLLTARRRQATARIRAAQARSMADRRTAAVARITRTRKG